MGVSLNRKTGYKLIIEGVVVNYKNDYLVYRKSTVKDNLRGLGLQIPNIQ